MADMWSELEQLHREGRDWEMATPGGAAVGGKPKRKIDYMPRTKTLAEYDPGRFQQAQQPRRSGSVSVSLSGTIPVFGPAEQAAMASGIANQTMDNIRRENDSRVSQNREMRRMAHEQELMRIKTQGEMARAEADRDAMLIRELLSGM